MLRLFVTSSEKKCYELVWAESSAPYIFKNSLFYFHKPNTNTDRYIYVHILCTYRGADKSLARPTSRCILFDG